jgi:predicted anti-sigma-YlaC factor YlaD
MSCDHVQLAISARMDGEAIDRRSADDLDDHVASCERCGAFASEAERVRAAVRIGPADPVPDLVSRIVGELETLMPPYSAARGRAVSRWQRSMPVAAALVAGAIIGSVLVGGPFRVTDRDAISANAVVLGVRAAAPALESFEGTFSVVERGLSPEVPERRLDVHIAFLAPQRFRLDVVDRTVYLAATSAPSSDLTFIQDATSTLRSGPTGCPAGLGAGVCPPTLTTLTAGSTPADLMVPVATFASAEGVDVLGAERVDGIEAVRLQLTFARAQAMFPFLWLDDLAGGAAGSSWRPFFPGDRVEVLLDAGTWVPRRITVYPAASERRRAWELRFGRTVEDPTVPILEVAATDVATDAPDVSLFEMPGATAAAMSIGDLAELVGYRPATPTLTGDLELETSIAPPIDADFPSTLLVYADGLDYLRVGERPGSHAELIAPGATRVTLAGAGIGYYVEASAEHGRRIAIVGDDTSLLLETNLPRRELFEIAGSIPVLGRALP